MLAASRAALRSAYVRAELDLAGEQGKRIVVALAEHVRLPAALGDAALVDVRRRFDVKVARLAAACADPSAPLPPARNSARFVMRPTGRVADAVDRALQARGYRRAQGDRADRELVVLSNLTPLAWLQEALERAGERAIVVICTPVALDGLERYERYQWVDFRRRSPSTLDGFAASLASSSRSAGAERVPERLSRRVLPFSIMLLGGWLLFCAATAVAIAATSAGGHYARTYGGSHPRLAALVMLVWAALFVWLATVLFARRIAWRAFAWLALAVFVAGPALQFVVAYPDVPGWILVPAFLIDPLLLALCSRTLAGWLPRAGPARTGPTLSAAGAPLWRQPALAVGDAAARSRAGRGLVRGWQAPRPGEPGPAAIRADPTPEAPTDPARAASVRSPRRDHPVAVRARAIDPSAACVRRPRTG